jgi:hypothetical protein
MAVWAFAMSAAHQTHHDRIREKNAKASARRLVDDGKIELF